MSLGSSDMAGSALGTAFSLLLLASIIQGVQDFEVFHHEKIEAVVGQNVTLPCTVKNSTNIQIVSIEWSKSKNENTKLAVYSQVHGLHQFWPNVTIQIENRSMGSYLHLSRVAKWDSGIYTCDLTTFPLGSIRRDTELRIKDVDVEIMCDVGSTVEVHAGENVTIHCRAFPNAEYRWTMNRKLVSEKESLELWWVTDAHAGVYALTVNTGNKSLHKEFIVTVLTATTSLRTDPVTVSPQSSGTEEGLIGSTDISLTTSPTTGLSTVNTNVTWTMSTGTDVTDDPNLSNVTVTAGERITSFTNYTHISITSSPATHTDPYHLNNSSDQEINKTHSLNTSTFSDQSVASNLSTTLSYGSKVFRSTQEMGNVSMRSITENSDNPGAAGNTTDIENKDTDGARSHLWLVLIIAPLLVLIAVAGILCRRKIIKQRMDLPPPFKPPPPPIKYTAARYCKPFPTSRCNSVTELTDMKQKCINI
ncbi:T-cell surface protein tactile [Siniperca chuatsi]|uniref:T-cell surface protein tactile n=1 Tax=Siniperca chuatsi TaxID=119488 RepID=UPI001CE21A3B|nr:T-cell surface protein tactile [Siniperca chuatsi]